MSLFFGSISLMVLLGFQHMPTHAHTHTVDRGWLWNIYGPDLAQVCSTRWLPRQPYGKTQPISSLQCEQNKPIPYPTTSKPIRPHPRHDSLTCSTVQCVDHPRQPQGKISNKTKQSPSPVGKWVSRVLLSHTTSVKTKPDDLLVNIYNIVIRDVV